MMERRHFLKNEQPILVSMVQGQTPERIEELMRLSLAEGAEAFGMQFCQLPKEYRKPEIYRALFSKASPLPVYVTNYRVRENEGKSDETLAEELVQLAECGATLCDMMGDYFDPTPGEWTVNPAAAEKQMALVERLHAAGAEVLMSSHIRKLTPAERVLEIALGQEARGADICKIVVDSPTMEDQLENMRIIHLLKNTLKIPFLFLSGGECHLLRRVSGSLGCCMYLCVHEYDALATKVQPLLRDVKAIRDHL